MITGTTNGNGNPSDLIARLYRNDNGLFADLQLGLAGTIQGGAAWADYNADGLLDFALTGRTNNSIMESEITRLYRNTGNGSFNLAAELPGTVGFPRWGDFDNDGRPDLLVSWQGHSSRFFHNNLPVTNSPPASPTGLAATFTNGRLTLSWNAATDANQTHALSYNVRAGTTPGANDVFSSMANPANGWRRLPQAGNAGQRLSWTLTNSQFPLAPSIGACRPLTTPLPDQRSRRRRCFPPTPRPTAPVAAPQLLILAEDSQPAITLTATDAEGQPLLYSIIASPTNGVLTGPPQRRVSPAHQFLWCRLGLVSGQ